MRDRIVILQKRTVLEELLLRHHSRAQLAFFLERRGESIAEVEAAHNAYARSFAAVLAAIPRELPREVILRELLPTYLFRERDLVIAVGPDGIVANAAKYLSVQPILGVNPDPARVDGTLVRFAPTDVPRVLRAALADDVCTDTLTLAIARTNDGQELLAVNEIFVGRRDHVSAQYTIARNGKRERQSSSGVIIATGVGSTGWMRSIIAGAAAVVAAADGVLPKLSPLPWNARALRFAVREPFPSRATGTKIAFGDIAEDEALIIASDISDGGAIFADGVMEDAIAFNAGTVVRIAVAERTATLIAP